MQRIRAPRRALAASFAVIAASFTFVAPSMARADWVTLWSGECLRGIDLRRHQEGYRFVREDGEAVSFAAADLRHVERAPHGEKVPFRGRDVSLREKARTLAAERKARDAELVALVERCAQAKPGETPESTVAAEIESSERDRAFAKALHDSRISGARRWAARQLTTVKTPEASAALALAALRDDYRSVRDSSLLALKEQGGDGSEDLFIRALRHESSAVRTRAANALSVLPSRRAVPTLIDTLQLAWQGFGRGYMMQVTQRAYIADYELVSGGTGFAIVEVADPVVQTSLTGVVLDVEVRRAELVARLRALRRITGQDFGADTAAWRRWWDANKDA